MRFCEIVLPNVQEQTEFLKTWAKFSTIDFGYILSGHHNGKLYYASGDSLFTSNGTPSGTVLVKKVNEPITMISAISIGSKLFFITRTGEKQSLWTSDGTSANTVKIGTHNTIVPLIAYQSELYLRINDGTHGNELWKVSNTNSLSMVRDINQGTGDGIVLFRDYGNLISNNTLFFRASADGSRSDLWKTDGTASGTVMAVDMPFEDHFFFGLTDVSGTIFFAREYIHPEYDEPVSEIWKTQGTQATTVLVKTFDPDAYNDLTHFTAMNGKLYFMREHGSPVQDLMVSDGTEAGTQVVKMVEIDADIYEMHKMNDNLVFYGEQQGYITAIQKSDGTASGTEAVHQVNYDYRYPGGRDPINLTVANDLVFFVDHGTDNPDELPQPEDEFQLWQSDLTVENTKQVRELYNTSFRGSRNIVAAGDKIFFTTSDPDTSFKLWYYDPQAPAGIGSIEREVWTGIEGYNISSIPVNDPPNKVTDLTIFEAPANDGDNYGARVRGYVGIPQTGDYTFWISSDDNSELWLSTDDDPANKVKIASVTGYTAVRQWTKYPSQKSAAIHLEGGRRYFIEAFHKEASGGDHLAVGWQLPDGTLERPIPGIRLNQFETEVNRAPVVSFTEPEDGQNFTAPASITITADAFDSDGKICEVTFYNGDTYLWRDETAPYSFQWNNVPAGNYTLVAVADDCMKTSRVEIQITVTEGTCAGTGTILREYWSGVRGKTVAEIPTHLPPTSTNQLTIFEGPTNAGDNYGTRIRGYICAPSSGNYTFWIASNDYSELWLSTDNTPGNKVKIASVTGATTPRQWTKYGSQKSLPINLKAGYQYYIEALHKEGIGTDNIAVGWQLPDGTLERPIPGNRLSPFGEEGNSAPVVNITSPEEGQTFNAPATITINADATDNGSIAKVEFFEGSVKLGEDLTTPYSFTWSNVPAGTYSLTAKATDDIGASTVSSPVNITVGGQCTASGTITREYWEGVEGSSVSDIPLHRTPDQTTELTVFEGPSNIGIHYGTRIRGYICVPVTGSYVFWIASNDHSELWLSSNEDPANKTRIANVTGATGIRQWTKYTSQQSVPIPLTEGKKYFIEALHKQGVGSDNIAVGWQLPNGTLERPIPGNRLSPFENNAATTAFQMENTTPSKDGNMYAEISIYPNPAQSSDRELTISGYERIDETIETHVEIINMTGEVVFAERISCGGNCSAYLMNINKQLVPGVYLVNLKTHGTRFSKRLLVK